MNLTETQWNTIVNALHQTARRELEDARNTKLPDTLREQFARQHRESLDLALMIENRPAQA